VEGRHNHFLHLNRALEIICSNTVADLDILEQVVRVLANDQVSDLGCRFSDGSVMVQLGVLGLRYSERSSAPEDGQLRSTYLSESKFARTSRVAGI